MNAHEGRFINSSYAHCAHESQRYPRSLTQRSQTAGRFKDNGGFNIMLEAFPLDGKIVSARSRPRR